MSKEPIKEELEATEKSTPKPRKPKARKPKDPHTVINIYGDITTADPDSTRFRKSVVISSSSGVDASEFIGVVDAVDNPDLIKTYSDEDLLNVGYNNESVNETYTEGALSKTVSGEGFVNHPTGAGKKLGIRGVAPAAKGHLTGADAIAAFTSRLNIGKHASVTLWHSGFTLLLAPPKESEIINLQFNISKQEHRLGMETSNMIYSNYGVVSNKLIVDFIMDHIVASSLELPAGESYLDYIKTSDLNQLEMGMISCMRSGKYPVTMTCGNSLELNEDNKPMCNFTATTDIYPENALWVNRSILTTELLAHVSKTSAGSHTAESVISYQDKLEVNSMKSYTAGEGDSEITIDVQTPTLRDYLDSGSMWVNKVIADTEAIIVDGDTEEQRDNKLEVMINSSMLNRYNSYIKRISIGDVYVSDADTVIDVLTTLSSESAVVADVFESITSYINQAYISIVATYNYDCPKCADAGREQAYTEGEVKGFKEFIPINVAEHFFAHSALAFTEIAGRGQ